MASMDEERLKARLEEQEKHLSEQLDTLAAEEQSSSEQGHGGYVTHVADDASETFDHERVLALARHVGGLLEQTRRALQKLQAGSYGRCDRCAEAIDPQRLAALPHASLCLACQTMLEGQH